MRKRTNVRRLPVVTEEPASMAITPMNVIVETDSWASIVKILSIIALSKTRVRTGANVGAFPKRPRPCVFVPTNLPVKSVKTTSMNALSPVPIPVNMGLVSIPMEATIVNVRPAGPARIARKTPTFVNCKTLVSMLAHVCPRWMADMAANVFQDTRAIYARSILTSALVIPVSMVAIARMASMGTRVVARQLSMAQLVNVRKDSQVITAQKKSTNVTLNLVRTTPLV